jgi:putative SOS response-associated peptidase YedK
MPRESLKAGQAAKHPAFRIAAVLFEVGEGEVFALAGLWDEWKSPEGQIVESCTILTTTANSLVVDLHDRMPVIVSPDKYDVWLDPDVNDFNVIRDILEPYDANSMRRYPVSRKLNNSKIDDADSSSPLRLERLQLRSGCSSKASLPCGLAYLTPGDLHRRKP